jgi:hypothetical protein
VSLHVLKKKKKKQQRKRKRRRGKREAFVRSGGRKGIYAA